jgi:hypothetical protein
MFLDFIEYKEGVYLYKMRLLLIIIFIIATGTFGLMKNIKMISISTMMGTFEIGQILLLIALLLAFLKPYKKKIDPGDKILLPLFLFILFIFFQVIRNFIQGTNPQYILRGVKTIYMFFYIFPIIIFIKNKSELNKIIHIIIFIGFVSATVAIFQFITGTTLEASDSRSFVGGFSRIYHPGAILMAFCFLLSISHFLIFGVNRKFYFIYLQIPILFLGILTTLARSLIGMVICCSVLLVLFYLLHERKLFVFQKVLLLSLLIIIGFYYFSKKSGFGIENLKLRADSAISDISYFSGNLYGRYLFILNSFEAIIRTSPIYGKGFDIKYGSSILNPFSFNCDATYNNVLLLFGVSGILLLLFLFYRIVKLSIIGYKRSINNSNFKAIYLTLQVMPIFFIVNGFFNALIISSWNLTVLITIIGILFLLRYFEETERKKIDEKIST